MSYRCTDCGHGEKLSAWAQANVSGRLHADGTVEESYSDQHELFEDSIQCDEHPSAAVEFLVDGAWCRRRNCEWRDDERHMRCVRGLALHYSQQCGPCPECGGSGIVYLAVSLTEEDS